MPTISAVTPAGHRSLCIKGQRRVEEASSSEGRGRHKEVQTNTNSRDDVCSSLLGKYCERNVVVLSLGGVSCAQWRELIEENESDKGYA
ncbi:hypothetical protein E2C01_009513 [Portunus trituberculatus]|uniref:Uncharacterized protein n=1 Tax=Portunus trituberculatus TaxID=210409 RepID=A0A5B7D601_PORTR|nr:hypothetical protein [Portunus trituberculatus]